MVGRKLSKEIFDIVTNTNMRVTEEYLVLAIA